MRNKDITPYMRYTGKGEGVCDHYCKKRVRNTEWYNWYSLIEEMKFIKRMCRTCALREMWGANYASTKGYKRWSEA